MWSQRKLSIALSMPGKLANTFNSGDSDDGGNHTVGGHFWAVAYQLFATTVDEPCVRERQSGLALTITITIAQPQPDQASLLVERKPAFELPNERCRIRSTGLPRQGNRRLWVNKAP